MASTADLNEPTPAAPAQTLDPISKRLQSLQLAAGERRGGGGIRWGRWLLLVLLIGGGIGAYFGYEEYKRTQIQTIPETEAISFGERAAGGILLDVTGYIVPKTKVQIAPQSAGRIVSLPIEEGMRVKKGDVLCKIEDDSYQAELMRNKAALSLAETNLLKLKNGSRPEEINRAKSTLASSEVSLREAKDNLDRAKKLRESGAASQSEYDSALAGFQTAENAVAINLSSLQLTERPTRDEDIAVQEAQVEQARASVKSAEINVQNTVILAPCDGTILEKNAHEGELILPQTIITSLCLLADLNDLEAEVDIQERELARIKVGHPCQVVPDAYPDHIYEAELARMQPQVNRARGVVPANIKIINPNQYPDSPLLSEMNCRVLFLKNDQKSEQQLPSVPSRALQKKDGESAVFVLENNLAKIRKVTVGKTLGDEVEIQDGLKTGEVVLLPGNTPIQDGQTIRAKLLDTQEEPKTAP